MYNLVVEPTPLKNISQIESFPQIGVKIKNLWNHHLEMYLCICTSSEDCTCVSVKNHAQMHQNKAAPKKTSPSHLFPSCTCQHSPIHDNWNKFMKHIPMYITFWKVSPQKKQRLRGWGIHVLLALSARKRIMKWSNWLLLNMYSEFPSGFVTNHGQTMFLNIDLLIQMYHQDAIYLIDKSPYLWSPIYWIIIQFFYFGIPGSSLGPKCFRYRLSIHHFWGFKDGTPTGRCWYTCILDSLLS